MNEHVKDPYEHWRQNVAGTEVLFHENEPKWGFYRFKDRDDVIQPAAIFESDGSLVIVVGREGAQWQTEALKLWTYVCNRPIAEETYDAVARQGKPWPEEAAAPATPGDGVGLIGDNNPLDPDSSEAITSEIDELLAAALKLIKNGVSDKKAADQATNLKDKIAALRKRADQIRVDLKRPHDEAGKAVQAEWKPVIDRASENEKTIGRAVGAWLAAEQKRLDEEAAENRRKEEAERVAAEKAALERAEPLPIPQKKVNPPAAPVRAQVGGASGKKSGLRTYYSAKVTDYMAALNALAGEQEIKDALQTAASRIARDQKDDFAVAGLELVKEHRA